MSAASIGLVQFTDTHLYAETDRLSLGVNTHRSFRDVLSNARAEFPDTNLLLVTGDLVNDHSAQGYRCLNELLSQWNIPAHCLPGNHDAPKTMQQSLAGGNVKLERHVLVGAWQIILLDSTQPGSDAGRLSAEELTIMEHYLQRFPDRHALISVHHNPVPVGSAWLDKMMIANADDFFAVLKRYEHVRGVAFGHVHQEFDAEHVGIRLLAAPSTCVQFKPHSATFAVDERAPGYRWLILHSDGSIATGIRRLEQARAA